MNSFIFISQKYFPLISTKIFVFVNVAGVVFIHPFRS